MLRRAIVRDGGFALYLVQCNSPAVRDATITRLAAESPSGVIVVQVSPASAEGADPLDQVTVALNRPVGSRRVEGPPVALMVTGFESYFREDALAESALRALNLRRSEWLKLDRVVAIWAPEFACTQLLRGAPDFLDWRTAFLEMSDPEVQGQVNVHAEHSDDRAGESLAESDRRNRMIELEARLATLGYEKDRSLLGVRAEYLSELALHARFLGEMDDAEKLLREALEIERKLGRLEGQASDLGNLGLIALTHGDLDAAEKLLREALEIARKCGWLGGQANALGNLGLIALTRGDLDAAEKFLREALEIERRLSRLGGQASDLGNLGLIALTRGDLDAAEKFLREALEINRKLGRLEGQATQLGNLGGIARTRGDLDATEKLTREALAIDRKLGRLEGQAISLGNLGAIAQTRGDLDAAEKLHREALAVDRKLGRLEGQASDLGNLGGIAKQRGNFAEARRLWTQSRDLYARIGIPHMTKQLQGWLDGLPPE